MDYLVIVHPAEDGGYWAEVPTLPGCFAQAETVDDLLVEAKGAIASHVAALHEDGQSIPESHGLLVATVRLPATAYP